MVTAMWLGGGLACNDVAWAQASTQAPTPTPGQTPVQVQEPAVPEPAARAPRLREEPLWELGFGAALLELPHYRGSDQSHTWLLPLPYAIYRGQYLRADREGARAVLLERNALEIDLSVAGTPPARSEGNRAREGMPDLQATFEIGPNANVTFLRGPDWKLQLRVPVRAAFTVERSPRQIGWSSTPYLTAEWVQAGWDIGVRAGTLWGDRRFNGHTYDVAPEFATATRAAYRAGGGFAGWQATAGASRRLGAFWIGTFVRADSVRGAAFEASPLVKRENTWAAGLAVSWVFATSTVRVKVPE